MRHIKRRDNLKFVTRNGKSCVNLKAKHRKTHATTIPPPNLHQRRNLQRRLSIPPRHLYPLHKLLLLSLHLLHNTQSSLRTTSPLSDFPTPPLFLPYSAATTASQDSISLVSLTSLTTPSSPFPSPPMFTSSSSETCKISTPSPSPRRISPATP
ncbi:unnamed protein product [Eruca vesicaria subsp. sativa]|uniref:Uncharacterized protein n=1 Tax=Eruca vesicaria subsp. sativa TaxID=29727 RepID=A0ABC8L1B6_ERUVS|nr:unnamed protein product [Eruca vesicaria subsp. sativa]